MATSVPYPPLPPPFFPLFFLFSFLVLTTPLPSTSTQITIPITPSNIQYYSDSTSDPSQILKQLASQSLYRAHLLKHLNLTTLLSTSLIKSPLHPRSYGGYSISLNFGTPPQTTTFLMDTGSSLVWFPCTSRYTCSNCNFSGVSTVPRFIPRLSSTAKIVGCTNPKCAWIFGPQTNCTSQSACSPYILQYGLGSTAGVLLSDTLDFPRKKFSNFLVGCSIVSTQQPEGIAGFGRSIESLPSQLGVKRFSYCLVSHKYDDAPVSSNLVLDMNLKRTRKTTPGLNYIPFGQNPTSSDPAYKEYYYVNLRHIIIGNKKVKLPHSFSTPGVDGNGGTIVDSGTTYTYMERPLFNMVEKELVKQMEEKKYKLDKKAENKTGLRPCFNISGVSASVPEMAFQFKGGAKMDLALDNYIVLASSDVACFVFITDDLFQSGFQAGPSIIIGNYQQMNFHLEFDLNKGRFGFKRQNCLPSSSTIGF